MNNQITSCEYYDDNEVCANFPGYNHEYIEMIDMCLERSPKVCCMLCAKRCSHCCSEVMGKNKKKKGK